MKSLLWSVLQTIVRTLIGSIHYDHIKEFVESVAKEDHTGEEKRALVLLLLQPVAQSVGTALVNLAIETAVNVLKEKK